MEGYLNFKCDSNELARLGKKIRPFVPHVIKKIFETFLKFKFLSAYLHLEWATFEL